MFIVICIGKYIDLTTMLITKDLILIQGIWNWEEFEKRYCTARTLGSVLSIWGVFFFQFGECFFNLGSVLSVEI